MSDQQQQIKRSWKQFVERLPSTLSADMTPQAFQQRWNKVFSKEQQQQGQMQKYALFPSQPMYEAMVRQRQRQGLQQQKTPTTLEEYFDDRVHACLQDTRPGVMVECNTPFVHAVLRRSRVPYLHGAQKIPRLDLVRVQTNPLFLRKGYFSRFLRSLAKYCRENGAVLMIESVIGPRLLAYIEKRPDLFQRIHPNDPYNTSFYYTPTIASAAQAQGGGGKATTEK
ncbi:hypothetical protein EBZ80_19980 [bacterium]|nr:hypothetical protein [bacterium]